MQRLNQRSPKQRLLDRIIHLKEERSRAILANAPEDDARAGEGHPDVKAIERQIREAREQVAAIDAAKEG